MNTYSEWAERYPEAAAALTPVLYTEVTHRNGGSEARAQQDVRTSVARAGAMAWRNNVGATPAKCPDCGARQRVVRYGLANDSARLNERIKSSDLILAIPRLIQPHHVGTTIAQFGSVEVKRPGWKFTGKGRESGQAAWLALIAKLGGYATFSTGDIEL